MNEHEIEEVVCRLRHGFYPYFDRKHDVFYWDRDDSRSVLVLSPKMLETAVGMESGIREQYQIRWNHCVEAVLDDLQSESIKKDTWLNEEVAQVYRTLGKSGHLKTVEAYDENEKLCGGLLGIELGKAFLAESMYHIRPNASKACLCELIRILSRQEFTFIDVQVAHPKGHPVNRLGETCLSVDEYLEMLAAATKELAPVTGDLRSLSQFPVEQDTWKTAKPTTVDSQHGKTLYLCGFQIMQEWELPLMTAMGNAVSSRYQSTVLEIGYGLGLSAREIQKHSPSLHVIVEANKGVSATAKEAFAAELSDGVVIVADGFWQDVLSDLPTSAIPKSTFDGILFDPYPLNATEISKQWMEFFPFATKLLKPKGRLTYFSDEIEEISEEHMSAIKETFPKSTVFSETISVTPVADCEYWQRRTILHIVIEMP